MVAKRLFYNWGDLSRRDKTDIITVATMKTIFLRGNSRKVGLREVNINIGKGKPNLRADVLQIDRNKNEIESYEIKSCIEDFRTDKKWEKYLALVNRLNFVFDSETLEKYKEEIYEKIGDKASIYSYNDNGELIYLQKSSRINEIQAPNADFYRVVLFNYLSRKARKALNLQ
nr:MAG TPA: DNA repair protein MmcB-like [Caudoviricetes sp.]